MTAPREDACLKYTDDNLAHIVFFSEQEGLSPLLEFYWNRQKYGVTITKQKTSKRKSSKLHKNFYP